MRIFKLMTIAVVGICLLAGCQQTPASTTQSTTASTVTTIPTTQPTQPTTPPAPQKVTGAYFSALRVNFGGYFVTDVEVTYGEGTITTVHNVDDQIHTNTYNYDGNLVYQRIDYSDGSYNEETRTYSDLNKKTPLSQVYTREGFSSEQNATFDEKGNVLTLSYTNSDGDWNTYTYTYDTQNNLLTESYVSSGGSDTKQEYVYDSNGNWTTFTKYNKGTRTQVTQRLYNENGHLVSETVYVGDPAKPESLNQQTLFILDDNGNVLTEHMTAKPDAWNNIDRTYDAAGNILTERYSDSDGYTHSFVRTYNDAGLVLSSVETYAEDSCTYTYEYDANGNQTMEKCTYSDGRFNQTIRTFDEKGNLLGFVATDIDGNTEKEARTYDEHGNLLTYTYYPDGETISSSCTYTYSYIELLPEEAALLEELMKNVFVEFLV